LRVEQGVDAADEDRGHGGDAGHGLALGGPGFQALAVGGVDGGELPGAEDQGHIDVDARFNGGRNGRHAGLGGGNLDHGVGPVDCGPEASGSGQGGGGVMGQGGGDLKADKTPLAAGFVINRAEDVAGAPDVGQHQGFEAGFGLGDLTLDAGQVGLIPRVILDGVVKNGRVGGDAGNGVIKDPASQFAGIQQVAGKIVEPDLLTVLCNLLEAGHGGAAQKRMSVAAHRPGIQPCMDRIGCGEKDFSLHGAGFWENAALQTGENRS